MLGEVLAHKEDSGRLFLEQYCHGKELERARGCAEVSDYGKSGRYPQTKDTASVSHGTPAGVCLCILPLEERSRQCAKPVFVYVSLTLLKI